MKTVIHGVVCEPAVPVTKAQHDKWLASLEEQCDESEGQGKRGEKRYE